MVFLVIIAILFFIIGWIIFTPLIITINTVASEYAIRQPGTFRLWLSNEFKPHLRIFGISVPVKSSNKKKDVDTKKEIKKKDKRTRSFQSFITLFRNIFNGISIKRFQLDLDTDDVSLNARMVPLFLMMNRRPVHLAINFEGRVSLNFLAEIKLYRIGWAFLLFITKK